jgi:hypothetical protein
MGRLQESQEDYRIYSGIDKKKVLAKHAAQQRAHEAAEEDKLKPKSKLGKLKTEPTEMRSPSGKPRNHAWRTMHASAPELFAHCHGAQQRVQLWFPDK